MFEVHELKTLPMRRCSLYKSGGGKNAGTILVLRPREIFSQKLYLGFM